jgi:hypothetical protein
MFAEMTPTATVAKEKKSVRCFMCLRRWYKSKEWKGMGRGENVELANSYIQNPSIDSEMYTDESFTCHREKRSRLASE